MPAPYVQAVADAIRKLTGGEADSGQEDLYLFYAVLALTKGEAVSAEDVHVAWCAVAATDGTVHRDALVPFDELTRACQLRDEPFAEAIREIARRRELSHRNDT